MPPSPVETPPCPHLPSYLGKQLAGKEKGGAEHSGITPSLLSPVYFLQQNQAESKWEGDEPQGKRMKEWGVGLLFLFACLAFSLDEQGGE